MSMKTAIIALALVTGLTACGTTTQSSRNVTPGLLITDAAPGPTEVIAAPQALAVSAVEISVPRSLRVSEADVFIPMADIVWRGDAPGDRHAQVDAIFQAASAKAVEGMTEGRGVIVSLEVTRFHGLTEKARYNTGGNYAIHFNMTIRDAQTGIVIDGPRAIVADIKGSGGARAIAEDMAGRTEKVVVSARITEVLRAELSTLVLQPEA